MSKNIVAALVFNLIYVAAFGVQQTEKDENIIRLKSRQFTPDKQLRHFAEVTG